MAKQKKIIFDKSKSVEVEKGYVVDNYLSKQENMGYSMVRTHLDGKHPFMKNVRSNRTYYLIDGEAIFAFDDEKIAIQSGEMLVIPKDTKYAFKGKFDAILVDSPAFDAADDVIYDEEFDDFDETLDTYNKIAVKYDQEYGEDFSDTPYIDNFLKNVNGKNILDIGCGTGTLSTYIANQGYNVDAIDFSDKMLQIARERIKNVNFMLADMRNIKVDKKYNGIMLAYSLFHISKEEVKKVLPKYFDLLEDDGVMLIILQEGEGEGDVIENLEQGLKKFVNFYSSKEIEQVLNESGFVIVEKERKKSTSAFSLQNDKLVIICKKKRGG